MPKGRDRPPAKCHPDRPNKARGLCRLCYRKYLYRESEKFRKCLTDCSSRYYHANRNKIKERARHYYQNGNGKSVWYRAHLKYKYGITPEQLAQAKEAQNHACKICGKIKKLHIDHCHSTGVVRGLICSGCNTLLGYLESTDNWLSKFTKYIDEASENTYVPSGSRSQRKGAVSEMPLQAMVVLPKSEEKEERVGPCLP